MQHLSTRTYLLVSGGIAGAVIGADLVRLANGGRIPPDRLRGTALAAAAMLAAVGLSNRHTRLTLELARRIERARSTSAAPAAIPQSAPHNLITGTAGPDGWSTPARSS